VVISNPLLVALEVQELTLAYTFSDVEDTGYSVYLLY
jgi:hypothetical protein